MNLLKPNETVKFDYPITIDKSGKQKLAAKVIWTTPNSSNRELIAESNFLELTSFSGVGKDSDSDGLPDELEGEIGTNPKISDTDGDDLPDGFEYFTVETDPLLKDTNNNGVHDDEEDNDMDKLTNKEELNLGTDPLLSDTDGDEFSDYDEVKVHETDPLVPDTDDDGLVDGSEARLEFNPLKQDTDSDGVIDSKEVVNQAVNEENLAPLLIKENLAQPQITINGQGDINNSVVVTDQSDNPLLQEIRGIVGFPIDIQMNKSFESGKIGFKISDEVLSKTKLENLSIAYYNDKTNKLELLKTHITPETHTLTAETTHFSTYFVIDITTLFYDVKSILEN